jgi:hypothetical protein
VAGRAKLNALQLELSAVVAVADVFNCRTLLHPSFGYTALDVRRSIETYVPACSLGAPVGIVRSPREATPGHVHWIIETHATRYADVWWNAD